MGMKIGNKEYDLSNAKEREAYWVAYAKQNFVGKKIVQARYLSQKEADSLMWHSRPVVFQMDDGSLMFPSCDDEGNDGGVIFGQTKDGKDITCPVL